MNYRHVFIAIVVVGLVGLAGCANTGTNTTPTPTTEAPTTPEPTTENPPQTTDSTAVRFALIHEYNPGTVEGMPTGYTEAFINNTIASHPDLADRIRNEFNITDKQQVFTKIQQTQKIHVVEQSDGAYSFTVRDGNACTTTVINGTYYPTNDTITEHNQTTETQPC